jgi:pre-mRNA-processing factor 40
MELTAPNGRVFFYNATMKQSVWEKPVELLTLAERADPLHIWEEHTNADGRKYYFNRITKVSTWTLPEDLKAAKESQAAQGAAPVAPVAGKWVCLSD